MPPIDERALLRIRNRQDENRFHRDYVPSKKANRDEAPGISWAIKIWVAWLGRHVHCLGNPEFHAALVALHHPDLVDIHEQKMLHTGPASHPLLGYPGYVDPALTPVLGTLSVASRLNCRQHHPRIMVQDPDDGTRAPVAYPYLGDFLLFLRQGQRIILINWTVKENEDDFRIPELASAAKTERQRQKLQRRLYIEIQYYHDINVPTVEVSNNRLDPVLISNLRTAFNYSLRETNVDFQKRWVIVGSFRSAVQRGEKASTILARLEQDGLCDIPTARTVFFQSIWDRSLRLDLYSNIILDAPLRPEVEDVFTREAYLFPGIDPPGRRSRPAR